jgi:hypothetical protein
MNSFYIISFDSSCCECAFGVTELPFESFCTGKNVHLFLPCYNHQEILDEVLSILSNQLELSNLNIDLSNNIVRGDLKRLIKICIKKIHHIQSESNESAVVQIEDISSVVQINVPVDERTLDNSQNNMGVENISVNLENKVDNDRFKTFDNFTFKIFQEMSNVNHLLTKVQTFKSNVSKVNKTLESLRRFKNITGIPYVVQSERPRAGTLAGSLTGTGAGTGTGVGNGIIPRVQMTPRGKGDNLTLEECKIWMKNKTVNPRTGRNIDINGPTYKKIEFMARMYKLI